jgi:hypothetical protein
MSPITWIRVYAIAAANSIFFMLPLERLFYEPVRGTLVERFSNVAFEDLAFVIDGAPKVDHLAVELHVHFVVPLPTSKAPHPIDPLPADIASKHQAEPVPPKSHGLMADVDASLE